MSKVNKYTKKSIDQAVKDKMRVLDDFYICNKDDLAMKARLEQAIAAHPDKDPREVLDYYCRPMIQDTVNSWR